MIDQEQKQSVLNIIFIWKRYKNSYLKKYFLFFCLFFFSASCNLNGRIGVYEQMLYFPNHTWSINNRPLFKFVIKDTASAYNIYVVLRHAEDYAYNNIWINLTTIAPGDTAKTQRLNLKLGDNNKWFGTEMDDIVDQRILITQNPIKLVGGNYDFVLQQIMREENLPGIINAGIRVEKQ